MDVERHVRGVQGLSRGYQAGKDLRSQLIIAEEEIAMGQVIIRALQKELDEKDRQIWLLGGKIQYKRPKT